MAAPAYTKDHKYHGHTKCIGIDISIFQILSARGDGPYIRFRTL